MITTVPDRPVHAPDAPLDWSRPLVAGEPFDVGYDDGSALTADYRSGAGFPGKLSNIVFDFSGGAQRR